MGEKKRGVDPETKIVARVVLLGILLIEVPLILLNLEFFTRPLPRDRYGLWGQLLSSSATAFPAKFAILTVLLAIPGSILGMMFRGQLLSKFGQTEVEPAPTADAMESIADTDSDVDKRLADIEDAVSDLVEIQKRQAGEEDSS